MTTGKLLSERFRSVLTGWLFAALSAFSVSSVSAETLVWYHFEEGTIDQKAAYHGTVVNAAGSPYSGTIDCYLDTKAFGWNNNVLPVYRAAFPAGVKLYDPVSKTVRDNAMALEFKTYSNQNMPCTAVRIADGNLIQPANFTIEMFIKATASSACGERLVNSAAWDLYANGGGTGNGRFQYKGQSSTVNGQALADLKWHHIAVVKNGGTITFYEDYKQTHQLTGQSAVDYSTVSDLVLGAKLNSTWGGWQGYMDEVRISDTALSPSQFLRMTIVDKDTDPDVYFHFSGEDYDLEAFGTLAPLATNLFGIVSGGSVPNDSLCNQPGNRLYWDATYGSKPVVMTDGLPGGTIRNGIADGATRTESCALQFNANQRKHDDYEKFSAYLHVDDPSDATLAAGSFTSECFIKYQSAPEQKAQYIMWQYGGENGNQKNSWCMLQNYGANGKFFAQFCYAGSNDPVQIPANATERVTLVDGDWHHIAFVYDKPNLKVSVYLDYELYGSAEGYELLSEASPTASNRKIEFGTGYNGFEHQMDGCFDEIRITRRALDPQEFLTTLPVAGGKTLFWANMDSDTKTEPYPEVSHAGVVAQATADITGKQCKITYFDGTETVEKSTGHALALDGGKLDFGRNLMLESERVFTVDFLAKKTSAAADAKMLEFKDGAGATVWSIGADVIPVGGWHSVTLQVDGANSTQTLFVDKRQVSVSAITIPASYTGSSFTVGDAGFVGCLDEVRVCRGLLTSEEMFKANVPGMAIIFR